MTPADTAFESVEARVQVQASVKNLALEVVSGDAQVAGSDFLLKPIVVKVTDANRLAYPGVRVSAMAGGSGVVEPSSAVTDENGLVAFAGGRLERPSTGLFSVSIRQLQRQPQHWASPFCCRRRW